MTDPVRQIGTGTRGVRGTLPSRKVGRSVQFESWLERDHLLLLEVDPKVATFLEQPCAVHFAGSRRPRVYTPDCRVTYVSGAIDLVEIKHASDLTRLDARERAELEEAFDAARSYCRERGWTFRLRTDADIRTPALARAQALHQHARAPDGLTALRARIEAAVADAPGVALGELARALGDERATTCALHLLWLGVLADSPPVRPPTLSTHLYPIERAP